MKRLIKKIDDDGRLGLVSSCLDPTSDIEVVDNDDLAAFERALREARALIAMSWEGKVPPAAELGLLQNRLARGEPLDKVVRAAV